MLTVSGLACARGGCQILAGIDFQLQAGEVLAVLGTNGFRTRADGKKTGE